MKLSGLPKTTKSKKKRVGRGYGSGVGGHTSTRGTKGQKSRSSVSIWFEGGQLPLSKRLPFLRGKDRFKSLHSEVTIVNISRLNEFSDNSVIDKKALVDAGLISESEAAKNKVKLLGNAPLKVALTIKNIAASAAAKASITKAGGSFQE